MSTLFIPLPISISLEGHSLKLEWSAREGGRETYLISPSDTKKADRVSHLVISLVKGTMSLRAIQWCADHNVAVTFLDKDYEPAQTFYPPSSCFPAMKRLQAISTWDDSYSLVSHWILDKIGEQVRMLEMVQDEVHGMRHGFIKANKDTVCKAACEATTAMVGIMNDIRSARLLPKETLRGLEGQAAKQYFSALAMTPIHWKNLKVSIPDSWKTIGDRAGMDGTSPRNATNPWHAVLNYGYGVLAKRMHIALIGEHLDPDLGFFHEDHNQRHNLVYDVLEPLRPIVDKWAWDHLIKSEVNSKDFHLTYEGQVRLSSYLVQAWIADLDSRLLVPVKDTTKHLAKTLRKQLDRKEAVS